MGGGYGYGVVGMGTGWRAWVWGGGYGYGVVGTQEVYDVMGVSKCLLGKPQAGRAKQKGQITK